MSSEWAFIDTDAAVLTELAARAQIVNVSVEPLAALEPAVMDTYNAVYGVLCFFKWKSTSSEPTAHGNIVEGAPVFFAHQPSNETCPTVGLVNVIANASEKVEMGPHLTQLVSFSQDLDPETRGMQLEEFDALRDAHNAFVPADRLVEVQKTPRKSKEASQCVAYIYKAGSIWELDGDQEGAILCGDATDETYKTALIDAAKKCEQEATQRRGGRPLSFCAMAVVEDPISVLTKQLTQLRKEEKPTGNVETALEEAKRAREEGKRANERRRFNYQPMIVELLKALEEKGVLRDVMEAAKQGKPATDATA